MQVLRPDEHIYAFYDGRDGTRFAEEPNWVDRGALGLGIASFAIVDGGEGLVYDAHVTIDRANTIRRTLKDAGVTKFTVVISHWHLDHVAATAAFEDCEIIANDRTAELLRDHKTAIEDGTHEGPPAINPLILPNRIFSGRLQLQVGSLELELHHVNIHSDDETIIWWPETRTLFAGDTLEDTVTYVVEPDQFDAHLVDLARLRALGAERILPCHGDPDVIAGGGYSAAFIDATELYIRFLMRCRDEPELATTPLQEVLAAPLASGALQYFEAYEEVHQSNLEAIRS